MVRVIDAETGRTLWPAEGSDGTDGRWRIARRTAPDRVISTVDPETRHAHKTRHRRQDGFRAHIVIEPDTGLITATELTKVNGSDNSDATVGTRLLAADTTTSQPGRAVQWRRVPPGTNQPRHTYGNCGGRTRLFVACSKE